MHDLAYFSDKLVAVLLWGDAFRTNKASWMPGGNVKCSPHYQWSQLNATSSQIENIIHPLERGGAKVDVIFTFPLCDHRRLTRVLHSKMASLLGSRVSATSIIETHSLEEALRSAWQLLIRHMNVTKTEYDFVLQMRHDIFQEQRIDNWPGTTIVTPIHGYSLTNGTASHMRMRHHSRWHHDKVLFESLCPQCGDGCNCGHNEALHPNCKICTNDHMIWVPNSHIRHVALAANTLDYSGHLFL